jgi:hypothetical protein
VLLSHPSTKSGQAHGIVKDANAWATEELGDARYPLSLLLRVTTVSLETMQIVRGLPSLDVLDERASPKGSAGTPAIGRR